MIVFCVIEENVKQKFSPQVTVQVCGVASVYSWCVKVMRIFGWVILKTLSIVLKNEFIRFAKRQSASKERVKVGL